MTPVAKALWYIEAHFDRELTLDEIAQVSGVSRFHLTRAFGLACGLSIMRYVRARRLTQAARRLADGAPDILTVALEAGYGSHEAFTRAFRDQFGLTPEAVRAYRRLDILSLTEPFAMTNAPTPLDPPRLVTAQPILIAGPGAHYRFDDKSGIPAQWQQAVPALMQLPGRLGEVTYGVCHNTDDAGNFDYVSGVAVSDFSRVPPDWARVRIPDQRYAVFAHRGHVSGIDGTFAAIFERWLPKSGLQIADAPVFERYDERFDPVSGEGEFEIWVPVRD